MRRQEVEAELAAAPAITEDEEDFESEAASLDARYYFLPKIDAQGIVEAVRGG